MTYCACGKRVRASTVDRTCARCRKDTRTSHIREPAAPSCLRCDRPVSRMRGYAMYGTRGPRVVDGARWRWFCSRACAVSVETGHAEDISEAEIERKFSEALQYLKAKRRAA